MWRVPRGTLRLVGLIVLFGLIGGTAVAANPPAYSAAVVPGAPGACCTPGCSTCCGPATCCVPVCGPCPPPDVCTCTTYKPVVDTRYHTQPITGYHNVCRTCYRKEPYSVTVPVTKVDCITVDEGCYKMVWCPKPVVKQIPRVEYHQQVCCRTVPYTVTQQVPHTMIQIVPEYRVHYCPETHTFLKPPCPCPPGPGCGAPGCAASATPPAGQPPQALVSAPVAPTQPVGYAEPSAALSPVPQSSGADVAAAGGIPQNNPYLRAQSNAEVWQTNRGPVTQ